MSQWRQVSNAPPRPCIFPPISPPRTNSSEQTRRAHTDPAPSTSAVALPTLVLSGETDKLWVKSITENLNQANGNDSLLRKGRICIYKIPASLKASRDKNTYIPHIVSIGPYHHGTANLKEMEQHKWRALQRVLARTGQDVNLYLQAMRELEMKSRACYTGCLNFTSNQFVEMMLLDGCFILECFKGKAIGFGSLGYDRYDPVFSLRSTTLYSIGHDMLMLENQLPLLVLDRLLQIQTDPLAEWQLDPFSGMRSVSRLALRFFNPFMPMRQQSMNEVGQAGEMREHILDVILQNVLRIDVVTQLQAPEPDQVVRQHCTIYIDMFTRSAQAVRKQLDLNKCWKRQSGSSQEEEVDQRIALVPCVTDLKDAGVKFKVRRNTSKIWDVKFENGVIYMPKIVVQDMTNSLFFNLVAFEQCHVSIPWASCKITPYVIFLDMLIDSAQDVSYLRSCKIIEHLCASDVEAANQLDLLTKGVTFPFDTCYLAPLCKEVNKYYDKKRNVWRAILRQRYFHNPWAIISVVAAFFVILFTFGQTFYTIYAYYKPPRSRA